jgi:putative FmdB family regulatory protein
MPIYDFECPECKRDFEHFLTIAECEACGNVRPCPVCGHEARKVITLGHGGVLRQDSAWVRGVASVLSDDERKPLRIETMSELRDYYAAHPNIRPRESHPGLPSSLGDVPKPETSAERRARLKKRALERVKDMRSVSINTPAKGGQSHAGPAPAAG